MLRKLFAGIVPGTMFIILILCSFAVGRCFAEEKGASLSLSIQANREVYICGEEVWISLTFKNDGKDKISFNKASTKFFKLKRGNKDSMLTLTLEDIDEQFAPFPIFTKGDYIHIQPGETFLCKVPLYGLDVGKYSLHARYELPPGFHDHVYDSFREGHKLIDMSDAWRAPLVSNTVAFKITERPKRLTKKEGFTLFAALDLRTPLIEQDDIVSYDWTKHIIKLTPEAAKKLNEYLKKNRPDVWFNRKFIVCIDGIEIYQGAFGTIGSSLSFDGPVILDFCWGPDIGEKRVENEIHISFGYPKPYPGSKDPRGDRRIYNALKKAGKLPN